MKDASRAWQKHFKHSALCFRPGAQSKRPFSSRRAVPHTPHLTSFGTQTHKSHPLPLGKRGSLPACPHCENLLLFTYIEMQEVFLTQSLSNSRVPFPGVPSLSLRINETLSDFPPAAPTSYQHDC